MKYVEHNILAMEKEKYKKAIFNLVDENKEIKSQLKYADQQLENMTKTIEKKNQLIDTLNEIIKNYTEHIR